MIFLLVILGLVIVYNLIMLFSALKERYGRWPQQQQFTTTQILSPQRPQRSIVLIHGFIGSPYDFEPVAKQLCEQGFRVVIPAMPGQNKCTLAYCRGKYDKQFYIDFILDIIKQETQLTGKKPYLMGFSMGGALSTIIAATNTVEKLILLAPFYRLTIRNNFMRQIGKIAAYTVPIIPKGGRGRINCGEGYKKYHPGSFLVSFAAFNQLQKIATLAKSKAPQIKIPILLCGSRNDTVACFACSKKLFAEKKEVTLREYTQSDHIILYDYEQQQIIKEILDFIKL